MSNQSANSKSANKQPKYVCLCFDREDNYSSELNKYFKLGYKISEKVLPNPDGMIAILVELETPVLLNQSEQPTLNQAEQPTLNQAKQPTLNQAEQPTLNQAEQPTLKRKCPTQPKREFSFNVLPVNNFNAPDVFGRPSIASSFSLPVSCFSNNSGKGFGGNSTMASFGGNSTSSFGSTTKTGFSGNSTMTSFGNSSTSIFSSTSGTGFSGN